jgi:hypothetical protein
VIHRRSGGYSDQVRRAHSGLWDIIRNFSRDISQNWGKRERNPNLQKINLCGAHALGLDRCIFSVKSQNYTRPTP